MVNGIIREVNTAEFIFHAGLIDFLPRGLRQTPVSQTFAPHQTVKHLVEALGVPHVEIGRIEVNDQPVAFGFHARHGDRVAVYPFDAALGLPAPIPASNELRFLLDNHLGRLATNLRILGFDAQYRNDFTDEELAHIARQGEHILLTRDRRLLMRKQVLCGYCPRSLDPDEQVLEVVKRYELAPRVRPFQRCLRCNTPLEPVAKEAVLDRLEPKTKLYYDEFHQCPACRQVYWKGSHYEHMLTLVDKILANGGS
jgi:uncharacterized protein with PIN domain